MKKCPKCAEEIQDSAKKCKHCGAKLGNWFSRHKVLTGFLGLFAFIVIAAIADDKPTQPSGVDSTAGSSAPVTVAEQQQAATATENSQAGATIPQRKAATPQGSGVQPATAPAPSSPKTQFGDGTYVVGTDIQAGTYRTRRASSGCYYARLKGFGNTVGDLIANNNTDAPAVITVASTDAGFESTRCGTWTQDLSAITASKTSFGDGIYIIGTDIEPGTYRNTGHEGCYYARMKSFGGSTSDLIANNNTDAVAVVTIAASDKGFESTRCGTWTKL